MVSKFFTFFICFLSIAKAEIYTANNCEEIKNSLLEMLAKSNPAKALIIMPLEGFLTEPQDNAFYSQDNSFAPLAEQIYKKVKPSKSDYVNELILTEYKQRFSDPLIPELFKEIQLQNIPFIVVTKNVSGNFNKIPYLEVWTWQLLLDRGIDLSKSPLGSKQVLFNKQHKKIKGTYPTFYKGLLSCNSSLQENSPQSVIAALLTLEINWLPETVYIIDKEEGYIKSVVQQFKSLNPEIQVEGFVYSPSKEGVIKITKKEFLIFWEKLVEKLNAVTRKNTIS